MTAVVAASALRPRSRSASAPALAPSSSAAAMPRARGRAGNMHGFGLVARQIGLGLGVPVEGPGMAEQMQGRRPAAAHQNGIAGDGARGLDGAATHRVDADGLDPQSPARCRGGVAGQHLIWRDMAACISAGAISVRVSTMAATLQPASGWIKCRVPCCHGWSITGRLPTLTPKRCRKALRGPRHHHAGAVVAVKYHRVFNRALRQNDLTGTDPPKSFTGGIGGTSDRWSVSFWHRPTMFCGGTRIAGSGISRTFGMPASSASVVASQSHAGWPSIIGEGSTERATHLGLLVHLQSPKPAARGGQCGSKASRTGANDQHIKA